MEDQIRQLEQQVATIREGYNSLKQELADLRSEQSQIIPYLPKGAHYRILQLEKNAGGVPTIIQTSRDLSDSEETVDIAHGLGRTPVFVRITTISSSVGGNTNSYIFPIISYGTFDGTNQNVIALSVGNGQGSQANTGNSYVVFAQGGAGANQIATIAVDETNISLTWFKTGSPSGTAYLLIEVL